MAGKHVASLIPKFSQTLLAFFSSFPTETKSILENLLSKVYNIKLERLAKWSN
jgi:hypothetical protein